MARAALVLVSVVLVAWFAVLVRDDQLASHAAARVHADPGMSGAEWSRSMERLRQAEFLNPGSEWRVIRANYLLLRDKPAALRVAEAIVREEPKNLDAWLIVLKAAPDPARRAAAQKRIRHLNPYPVRHAR
jgi:hypothetical protein